MSNKNIQSRVKAVDIHETTNLLMLDYNLSDAEDDVFMDESICCSTDEEDLLMLLDGLGDANNGINDDVSVAGAPENTSPEQTSPTTSTGVVDLNKQAKGSYSILLCLLSCCFNLYWPAEDHCWKTKCSQNGRQFCQFAIPIGTLALIGCCGEEVKYLMDDLVNTFWTGVIATACVISLFFLCQDVQSTNGYKVLCCYFCNSCRKDARTPIIVSTTTTDGTTGADIENGKEGSETNPATTPADATNTTDEPATTTSKQSICMRCLSCCSLSWCWTLERKMELIRVLLGVLAITIIWFVVETSVGNTLVYYPLKDIIMNNY